MKETKEKYPSLHKMCVSLDQGELLKTMLKLMNAKKGIEVGTFTGSSAFAFAEALPQNGQLLCLDISAEYAELGRKYWKMAGLDHKIKLEVGPALDTLNKLVEDQSQHG